MTVGVILVLSAAAAAFVKHQLAPPYLVVIAIILTIQFVWMHRKTAGSDYPVDSSGRLAVLICG